jgi:hypothetical protein
MPEEKFLEDRKQDLIEAIFKEREVSIELFDQKLAKLGRHPNSGRKRSHHKKTAAEAGETAGRAAAKPKA